MWINEKKNVYFYFSSYCFNLAYRNPFYVTPETRKEWENGISKRIAGNCLSEWEKE